MPATRPADAESTSDIDFNPHTSSGTPFTIKYDKLIISVGAYVQSRSILAWSLCFFLIFDGEAFNVPGVKEHAHFLKVVKDARKIRSRILEC